MNNLIFSYCTDPPGPPQSPEVVEVTSETASLTWQVPAFDGGSPITGYHVERHQTDSTRWVKVNKQIIPDLEYKVKELITDSEYEFRIMAENAIGVGPPSSPTAPITAKDPYSESSF